MGYLGCRPIRLGTAISLHAGLAWDRWVDPMTWSREKLVLFPFDLAAKAAKRSLLGPTRLFDGGHLPNRLTSPSYPLPVRFWRRRLTWSSDWRESPRCIRNKPRGRKTKRVVRFVHVQTWIGDFANFRRTIAIAMAFWRSRVIGCCEAWMVVTLMRENLRSILAWPKVINEKRPNFSRED